ncbi:alpha-1,2-fucosyltransferase [Rhizobium sullae]|nr:alpha-1,2-fucosyltransferase [Rhizobium sullae]
MVVITHIVGGLGNQMFQYAVGRSLSVSTGQTLKLDLASMKKYTRREFSLQQFNIHAELARPHETPVTRSRGFLRRAFQLIQRQSPCQHITEKAHTFDPTVMSLGGSLYFDGYWQSEKYFASIANTIRSDFSLAAPLSSGREAILSHIRTTNAVSVHVRRGDYVTNPSANATHGTIEPGWYEAAMQRMAERTDDPSFFVFSDDPAWAQQNLKSSWKMTFVEPQQDGRDGEDMHLMAACRNHITANSTFSWWGAWLNANPAKHVIAPLHWFRSPLHDDKDLIPATWERV